MSLDNNMWVIAKPGIFEEGRALNSATVQWSHAKNSIRKFKFGFEIGFEFRLEGFFKCLKKKYEKYYKFALLKS